MHALVHQVSGVSSRGLSYPCGSLVRLQEWIKLDAVLRPVCTACLASVDSEGTLTRVFYFMVSALLGYDCFIQKYTYICLLELIFLCCCYCYYSHNKDLYCYYCSIGSCCVAEVWDAGFLLSSVVTAACVCIRVSKVSRWQERVQKLLETVRNGFASNKAVLASGLRGGVIRGDWAEGGGSLRQRVEACLHELEDDLKVSDVPEAVELTGFLKVRE